MRLRTRRRTRVASLIAAATVAVGAGCSDSPQPRNADEAKLAALAGVRDVAVTEEQVDQDQPGTVVVVDLERDVTADEVAAVLAVVDELDPALAQVYVDWGTTDSDLPDDLDGRDHVQRVRGHDPDVTPADQAAWFVAAVSAFPDAAVTSTSAQGGQTRVEYADGDRSRVGAALELAVDDEVLARARNLVIAGPASSGVRDLVVCEVPPTSDLLARFRAMERSLALLPADIPGAVEVEAREDGTSLEAEVVLPGVVPPQALTTATWGARLWPFAQAHLDLLADLGDGGSYALGNHYRSSPDGAATGWDEFVTATMGEPVAADEHGRTWRAEARAYLDRRLAPR